MSKSDGEHPKDSPGDDRKPRGWGYTCTCAACHLANVLLALAVLLQVTVLGLVLTINEVPVPEGLASKLQEVAALEGVDLRWRSAVLRPEGALIVSHPAIAESGGGEILFEADHIALSFAWIDLLLGQPEMRSLRVVNGRAFLPSLLSESGMSEPVIDRLHTIIRRSGRRWQIEQTDFALFDTFVEARGDWSVPDRPALPQPPWRDRYYRITGELAGLQQRLDRVDGGTISLKIDSVGTEGVIAHVEMSAQQIRLDTRLNLEEVRLSAPNLHLGTGRLDHEIAIEARRLHLPQADPWRMIRMRVTAPSLYRLRYQAIDRLQVAIGHASLAPAGTGSLVGEGSLREWPRVRFGVESRWDLGRIDLSGSVDVDQQTAVATFSADADPVPILHHERLRSTILAEVLEFPSRRGRATGQIRFGPGFAFDRITFDAASNDVVFRGAWLDYAAVSGQAGTKGFSLDSMILEKQGRRVRGSYHEDTAQDLAFRLRLSGDLNPIDLNPMLPDWWDQLFADMTFGRNGVSGDVAVRGHWAGLGPVRAFGHVHGGGFAFRGIEVNAADLKFRVQPGRVDLFDLEAAAQDGASGNGTFTWVYDGRRKIPAGIHIDFRGTLFPHELEQLFEVDLGGVHDLAALSVRPEVHLAGVANPADEGRVETHAIGFTVRTDAPFRFGGFAFESADLVGTSTPDRVDIEPLRGRAFGGSLDGRLSLRLGSQSPSLELSATAQGMRFGETVGALRALGEGSANSAPPSDEPSPLEGAEGELDLEFTGNGVLGELASFSGEGTIGIRKADLGTVYLFGDLSRVLSKTWVDFTSMEFQDGESAFTLADGVLNFPRIVVGGVNGGLRASGDLALADGGLDFRVNVFLGENPSGPISSVLNPLLKPLGYALELRLRGDLDDPQWRLSIDPRNMLRPGQPEPPDTPAAPAGVEDTPAPSESDGSPVAVDARP